MSTQGRGLQNIVRSKSAPTVVATAVVAQCLAANKHRLSAVLVNAHASVVCYIGRDNTVTAANGIPLAAGASFTDNFSTDAWFVIPASSTTDLRVLEVA